MFAPYFLNPVVVMLYNTTEKRFHPIIFVEHPLPGSDRSVIRHKSKMHHTTGFERWSEARDDIYGDMIPKLKEHVAGCENVRAYPEYLLAWDGNGIPASVVVGNFSDAELEKNKQLRKELGLLDIEGEVVI